MRTARLWRTGLLEHAAFGALLLVALSFAFERLDASTGLTPDLRLTNLRLVLALALGLWMLACGQGRHFPRVPLRVAAPAAVWLMVVVISALVAPTHQTEALAFTRDLCIGAAAGWAAYDLARRAPWRRDWLVRAMAVAGAGVGALGVAEAVGIAPVVDWLQGFRYQSFQVGELSRVSSSLPHPNIAAMVLGLTVPLLVAWVATARSLGLRVVLAFALLACVTTLVLTVSRSGVLVLVAALGLIAGIGWWQHHTPILLTSLATLAGVVLVLASAILLRPVLLLHLTGESSRAWYSASYDPPATISARPGEVALVPVRVANTGLRTWVIAGTHRFALSYHLLGTDDRFITYDGVRTEFAADVLPGTAVEVQARLAAPPVEGEYVVEWDQVHESTTWFSWAGTAPARTRLMVSGVPTGAIDWRATQPPDERMLMPSPGRLELWRMALRMARNSPLLGIGPDNFRWVYGDFAEIPRWDTGVHANNLYMEWLADTGVLGLGAFVWFSVQLLRTVVRSVAQIWQFALVVALGRQPDAEILPLAHFRTDRDPLEWGPKRRLQLNKTVWMQAVLPWQLARLGADVCHFTNSVASWRTPCPAIVTIHDTTLWLFPALHPRRRLLSMRPLIPPVARRAKAIIAVSESAKADIVRILKVPAHRVHVVYEAAAACFQPLDGDGKLASVRQQYQLPEQFVLHVGTIEPRKNLVRLLEAYSQLGSRGNHSHHLVLVGSRGWKDADTAVFKAVERLGLGDMVHVLGYVPTEQLVALYNLADCLAFPSLYEGFGLPVVEAMACGTPVVASRRGALPEIAASAAEYVDPTDVDSIAEGLLRVLSDSDRQAALRQAGRARAAHFSWTVAAAQTRRVYDVVTAES
jgi:glycosyltransferase involved in cell wall biosynthesis/O-antigen ligase